jgi:hypothetical protein
MTTTCNAKTRSGTPCQRPAGWGTQHVGNGRCKLHGGNAGRPIEHGRYATVLPDRILKKAVIFKEGDPLDIFDELAIQRALFVEYAGRFQDGIPMTVHDVETLMNFTSEIMRSVERIVKIRNDTALTGAEVAYLMARAIEVAEKYFDDPAKQEQFLIDLFGQDETARDVRRNPALITRPTE